MQRRASRLNAPTRARIESRAITFLDKCQDEGGIERKSEQVRTTWWTEKLIGRLSSDIWRALGDDCHVWETIATEIEDRAPIFAESFVPGEQRAETFRERQLTISLDTSRCGGHSSDDDYSNAVILRIRSREF